MINIWTIFFPILLSNEIVSNNTNIMMKSHYSTTNLNVYPENEEWGWDSVTNRELGWHLTGKHADQRRWYVYSVIEHLKMPKIDNKKEAIKMLSNTNDVRLYISLTAELRDDFEILEILVKDNYGYLITHASERLQNDPEMAKIVMKQDTTDINYLNDNMKDNFDVMKVVAEQGSDMIRDAGINCLSNKTLALISVCNNPSTLIRFSSIIRDDPEVVLEAFSKNRDSLKYASPRFINSLKMQYLPLWILNKIKIP